MAYTIKKISSANGTVTVPGDKSISHHSPKVQHELPTF